MARRSSDNTRLVYSSEVGRVSEPQRAQSSGPPTDGIVRVSRTSSGQHDVAIEDLNSAIRKQPDFASCLLTILTILRIPTGPRILRILSILRSP